MGFGERPTSENSGDNCSGLILCRKGGLLFYTYYSFAVSLPMIEVVTLIIKNVTAEQLELSLKKLNELYNDPCYERDWELREIIRNEGNVIWKRYEQKGKRFHVTLECRSRWASGHRTHQKPYGDVKEGFTRSKSACWHVHGDWFDILLAINEDAVITTAGRKVTKDGGNWQDWNIGSMIYPQYFSDACEC